jgi:hypothetical protein
MLNRPDRPGYFCLRGPGLEPQPVEVGWENEQDPSNRGPLVVRYLGTTQQDPLDGLDPECLLVPLTF